MFLVHPAHCLPFLLPFPLLLPLPFRVFSLRLGAELANVIILQGFQVFGNNKRLFSLSPACTQTTMLLAGRFSLRHRRIESDAERCCGRDRCHSGGFLLRIMPPSWPPVPACAPRLCCRRDIPHYSGDGAASIPKSGLEIKNRCTQEGLNGEKLTSILKFGLEIKNRCTKEGVNGEKLASIRKFGLEIKNRCTRNQGFIHDNRPPPHPAGK